MKDTNVVSKTIGYNAKTGLFMINGEWVDELEVVVLGHREVERDMRGISVSSLQIFMIYNDEPYIFGTRSYTTKTSWVNSPIDEHYNDAFDIGILDQIMSSDYDHAELFSCRFTIKASSECIKIGSGRHTTYTHPIIVSDGFHMVGSPEFSQYMDMYYDWVNDWVEELY